MNRFIIVMGLIFVFNCAGTRPTNLGVNNGKLLPCPATPNCVSSQSDPTDNEHYILPYKYSVDTNLAFTQLKTLLEKQDRVKIINSNDTYINAEFTSLLMRFVDDVEFYFDEKEKMVHIRSASRLGKGDMGVNRKRMELIRKELGW
ncbi:MAG TPA: DUF1499 domain-containing protein [Leptospiraceae bacterium]|nr:DUF1499 domain-containing protein [Leptospiraceae bacterium]HMW04210.1 DUF1499 domain-containing protein [Leptospiraceae bacterium]HMX33668.1 DUF1499 domain-containing protein [Leptospiraceae bacterium]HMY30203.1 DUF1499 domain-containing protein [Leptospiraceae bacterium]HNA06548.1 DUF1499 domain-containing protein [Leptospiraceae bacterium]